MSHRSPVRVADRHAFHTLIDARSPAEYALDHIPGAINCPVLDDDERRIVGTIYKQQGAFEARRVGGAMVAANLARHLRTQFADQPASWKPLIYCWRGGMRSGSMVTWLRLVGWDAQQLAGGYKSWRRHVIDRLAELAPQLPLRVICGPTGSAKTRVLQALAARGAQVLDLEACARHRGSVLGAWPGVAQPSQTAFETALLHALEPLDLQRTIYVEAESSKIGRLAVPQPLVQRLRASNGFADTPSHEEVAATQTPDQARATYRTMAQMVAGAGFNFNFGPVVDLRGDPLDPEHRAVSPVIGQLKRSFSDDPARVVLYASQFILAHREAGVLYYGKGPGPAPSGAVGGAGILHEALGLQLLQLLGHRWQGQPQPAHNFLLADRCVITC